MSNKRAISVKDIMRRKFDVLPFDGLWREAIGRPEITGSWIIWGQSGSGKTRFALQLAKYLSQFTPVLYDSLEEGISLSFRRALMDERMDTLGARFKVLDSEPIHELRERLHRRRSPRIVFIDSLQYAGLTYPSYKKLRAEFPRKLFVFISHADGKLPAGRVGKKVRYDAFVKIRVEGYRAFPVSRYGGGKTYTIWETGAKDYWSEIDKNQDK